MKMPWNQIETRHAGAAILIVSSLTLMAGCMPSSQSGGGVVKGPEDYVYKGKSDPLMNVSGEERAETLSERFQRIQARE